MTNPEGKAPHLSPSNRTADTRAPLVLCGVNLGGVSALLPDLVVLPEGVSHADILRAEALFPAAVVAGAILDGQRMRAVVSHRGINQVDYLKVGSDQRTCGGEFPRQTPVYDAGPVSVGILICMDVQIPELANRVLGSLGQSAAPFKVLCIPADMDLNWFAGDDVSHLSRGAIHVALSNNAITYPEHRLRSFITDHRGQKAKAQVHREAISLRLSRARQGAAYEA